MVLCNLPGLSRKFCVNAFSLHSTRSGLVQHEGFIISRNLYRLNENKFSSQISRTFATSFIPFQVCNRSYGSVVGSKSTAQFLSSSSVNPERTNRPLRKLLNLLSSALTIISDMMIEIVTSRSRSRLKPREDTQFHTDFGRSRVVSLVDISWLKEHEEVVSEERVQNLYDAIVQWNAYKTPLLVDSRSGAILDGHHRYQVGRRMGLSKLPVILVDYLNDKDVIVDVWPECGLNYITKKDVIEMSLSDKVYPPKTSKHDFVASSRPINVSLEILR